MVAVNELQERHIVIQKCCSKYRSSPLGFAGGNAGHMILLQRRPKYSRKKQEPNPLPALAFELTTDTSLQPYFVHYCSHLSAIQFPVLQCAGIASLTSLCVHSVCTLCTYTLENVCGREEDKIWSNDMWKYIWESITYSTIYLTECITDPCLM